MDAEVGREEEVQNVSGQSQGGPRGRHTGVIGVQGLSSGCHRPSDFGQDLVGDPRFLSGYLGPRALLPSLRSVSWGKYTLVLVDGTEKGSLFLHHLPWGRSFT